MVVTQSIARMSEGGSKMRIMYKKVISIILVMLMVMGGMSGIIVSGGETVYAAVSEFAGGNGITEATAFEIETADQLNAVRNHLGTVSAVTYFKLVDDVDLSAYATGQGWEPIGTYLSSFYGIIDGNDHTITGLTINRSTDFVGLFGQTGEGSSINNIKLKDVIIKGQYYLGGLVGNNDGGNISNSYVTGSMTGAELTGGLVGINMRGNISNSYVIGSVIGGNYNVGGLVGSNYQGDISNSYFTGDVSGGNVVGGLLGNNNGGDISNSYTTGSVSGRHNFVGGMVGYNSEGDISNSYATGSVTGGGDNVGGMVGYIYKGNINNSYATGRVIGSSYVGGLVGKNSNGIISSSYYDLTTTGQTDTGRGLGVSTGAMKSLNTYVNWSFSDIWAIDSLHNNGYPYLNAFQINLNYDGNGNTGGDAPIDSQLYSSGVTASVYSDTVDLVKTNYTFDGWNSLANGRGKSYEAGETFTLTTNKTLYANWKQIIFTVSFNSNGGSTPASQLVDYNGYADAPTTSTRLGYTFAGWYADSNLTAVFDFSTTAITVDTILFAKWLSNNASLNGLSVNSGALNEPFSPATTSYTQSVANGVTSLTVIPTVAVPTTIVEVNGTIVASNQASAPIPLSVGDNTTTIVLTAEDNSMNTYTIVVTRAAGDTTQPILTLIGNATVNLANGATYTDAGASATDDQDGDLTNGIITTISNDVNGGSALNTSVAGTYTYHYNVSDAASNTATEVTRIVVVAAVAVVTPTPPTAVPTQTPVSTPIVTPSPSVPTATPKSFYNEKVNIDVIKAIVEKAKSAPAVTFKDVPKDSPTAKAIELASKLGIVKGYEDGSFHANATVSRAEFATMLVKALGLNSEDDSSFKDTKGHWAAEAIARLEASGIINGYWDGTFKPNQTISRAEIVAMLSKAINIPLVKSTKFNDVSGHWAEAEIDTLSDMGIVKGTAEGSFKPNANATRSESLLMILRMLNVSLSLSLDIE
jgi:uncharacterized repeat protein (TIGR02543 family)